MRVLQIRGGGTAEMDALVGSPRELTIDTERNEIRLHDGVTPGGKRILNIDQIALYGPAAFDSSTTQSTPGTLPNDVVGAYSDVSAAGDYDLPLLVNADVGNRMIFHATVAGVNLGASGANLLREFGTDHAAGDYVALSQDETIEICKKSTSRWVVTNRY